MSIERTIGNLVLISLLFYGILFLDAFEELSGLSRNKQPFCCMSSLLQTIRGIIQVRVWSFERQMQRHCVRNLH